LGKLASFIFARGPGGSNEEYGIRPYAESVVRFINHVTRLQVVEAAGVELFSALTARKLLILRMARGAKKAPLPIPLYVYCTKIVLRFCLQLGHHRASIPQLGSD